MRIVTLEDKGQDFLYFEYDEKKLLPTITDAGPFQRSTWKRMYILNAPMLEQNVHPIISKDPDLDVIELKYKILTIEQVVFILRIKTTSGRSTVAVCPNYRVDEMQKMLDLKFTGWQITEMNRSKMSLEMYEELRIDGNKVKG